MAQVKEFKPKDLARILKALPRAMQLPVKRIDHDAGADVLYLSFDRPQQASDSQLRDDGIIVHRRGKKIVGVTILEASSR